MSIPGNKTEKTKIILSLDIGSSSIRCSPYITATTTAAASTTSTMAKTAKSIKAVEGCVAVRKICSVRPNTGKIILSHDPKNYDTSSTSTSITTNDVIAKDDTIISNLTLFDEIDNCIDETLASLRSHFSNENSDEKNRNHNHDETSYSFQIIGIGISSFVMNLIGINKNANLINEESTLSYACNSSDVVQECTKLKEELGPDGLHDLYQRTGSPLHNAYALAQLRVHYQNQNLASTSTSSTKENDEKEVHQWTTISSYCILRWIGQGQRDGQYQNFQKKIPISFSEASWTGLFNFHQCKWDDKCLDLLPSQCRAVLPLVSDFSNQYYNIDEYVLMDNKSGDDKGNGRRVRNPYWERWPELRSSSNNSDDGGCRIYLGIGDGVCANIGSKCSSTERIACTIGTSAAARLCLPYNIVPTENEKEDEEENNNNTDFVVPFGLFCYRIDKHHVLLGGALTDGGSMVEFLRKLLNLKSDDDFLSCIQEASNSYSNEIEKEDVDNQQQLGVVPFLSGERSTGFRGGATGCILGMTRDTNPSDVLKSCLESVILRLNEIIKLIEKTTGSQNQLDKANCIVASGNALEKNTLWRQMLSDCAGKRVVKDGDAHEGTSRGVAILILRTISDSGQNIISQEDLVVDEEQIPNPNSEPLWSKHREYQESAIQCISPMWK